MNIKPFKTSGLNLNQTEIDYTRTLHRIKLSADLPRAKLKI